MIHGDIGNNERLFLLLVSWGPYLVSGGQQLIFNQILLVEAELLGCCWVLLRHKTIKDSSFQGCSSPRAGSQAATLTPATRDIGKTRKFSEVDSQLGYSKWLISVHIPQHHSGKRDLEKMRGKLLLDTSR